MAAYEVVLSSAARGVVRNLGSRQERVALAACLREELGDDGPNAGSAVLFDPLVGGNKYIAVPLSFNAFVAIYRPMNHEDLERLGRERRGKFRSGYFVFDLLPPEAGFHKLGRKVPRGLS